jgi:hypothetical protein
MQTNASQEVNAASSSDVGRLIDANCGVQEYTINSCVISSTRDRGSRPPYTTIWRLCKIPFIASLQSALFSFISKASSLSRVSPVYARAFSLLVQGCDSCLPSSSARTLRPSRWVAASPSTMITPLPRNVERMRSRRRNRAVKRTRCAASRCVVRSIHSLSAHPRRSS